MTKFVRKSRLAAVAVFAAMLPALLVSCGKKEDADPVALTVNGEAIMQSEINDALTYFRAQQMMVAPESAFEASSDEKLRKDVARQLAADKLLLGVVRERGWVADPARVDAMVELFVAQFPSREIFEQQLEHMGESEESMRRGMSEEMLIDSLLSEVVALGGAVTEEDARAHYDANKERYTAVPRVRISQIVFSIDVATASDSALRVITEKAVQVHEQAKAGADFNRLIERHSSKPQHGDVGWLSRGDFPPELERIAFALPKDGVSEIIPSEAGLLIIKKTDEEPPRQQSFEEVSAAITRTLGFLRRGAAVNDFVDSLLAKADIKFIDKTLEFEIKTEEETSTPPPL